MHLDLTCDMLTLCISAVFLSLCHLTQGHGYLASPPARSSAWRRGFDTPINYSDMGLNCGGTFTQHEKNGGRCGVCGDNYANVLKPNEPGPGNSYAQGVIVANYVQGQTIEVEVEITAFHLGHFEFKLCQNDVPQRGYDAAIAVKEECFNMVPTVGGDPSVTATAGTSFHQLKLPAGVTCKACVLRWGYITGNNGGNPSEEFYGCADVAITGSSTESTMTSSTPSTSTATSSSSTITSTSSSSTITTTTTTSLSSTTPSTTTSPTTTSSPDPVTSTVPASVCYSTIDSAYHNWCENECSISMSECITKKCWCVGMELPEIKECKGKDLYGGKTLNTWCNRNCNHLPPFCPPSHCSCESTLFVPPTK